MPTKPLKKPSVSGIMQHPNSQPDLTSDLSTSQYILSECIANCSHYDITYSDHIAKISKYLFAKMHPCTHLPWVEFITRESTLQYLHMPYKPPANPSGDMYADTSAVDTASRIVFVASNIPDTHKHLIPKNILASWLGSPNREVRVAALAAFPPKPPEALVQAELEAPLPPVVPKSPPAIKI